MVHRSNQMSLNTYNTDDYSSRPWQASASSAFISTMKECCNTLTIFCHHVYQGERTTSKIPSGIRLCSVFCRIPSGSLKHENHHMVRGVSIKPTTLLHFSLNQENKGRSVEGTHHDLKPFLRAKSGKRRCHPFHELHSQSASMLPPVLSSKCRACKGTLHNNNNAFDDQTQEYHPRTS